MDADFKAYITNASFTSSSTAVLCPTLVDTFLKLKFFYTSLFFSSTDQSWVCLGQSSLESVQNEDHHTFFYSFNILKYFFSFRWFWFFTGSISSLRMAISSCSMCFFCFSTAIRNLMPGLTEIQVLCVSAQKEFSKRQGDRQEVDLLI